MMDLPHPFPVPGGSERSRPAAAAWVMSRSAHFAAFRTSATHPITSYPENDVVPSVFLTSHSLFHTACSVVGPLSSRCWNDGCGSVISAKTPLSPTFSSSDFHWFRNSAEARSLGPLCEAWDSTDCGSGQKNASSHTYSSVSW
ncbi:uncharacterized protein BO80DRAFT_168596 [Aspergillus ibericus CBS 121593]|uniref:Uncharacterized protein n=1 Tax=Aspergillus ibericus CBS 121593 TaxID=1448316 RepID=A0A395GRN7_9EURO|nr:hypothetical protein BO80DRAFT_168596 [Aspergillus ibericus CBS 121593]RAK98032.1 hypothetical protein BO80DRAFT_168596 [Aspergillus ibericus CBS 121593]